MPLTDLPDPPAWLLAVSNLGTGLCHLAAVAAEWHLLRPVRRHLPGWPRAVFKVTVGGGGVMHLLAATDAFGAARWANVLRTPALVLAVAGFVTLLTAVVRAVAARDRAVARLTAARGADPNLHRQALQAALDDLRGAG